MGWFRRLRVGVENTRKIVYMRMMTNEVPASIVAEFGRKYLWWKPADGRPHSEDRIIAQTMNLGTYDDILLLEQTMGRGRLVNVMLHAEPGWIDDRSWEFWRGRLSFATGAAIPQSAPRRTFDAARPRDRKILCDARDRVGQLPQVQLKSGSLAGP